MKKISLFIVAFLAFPSVYAKKTDLQKELFLLREQIASVQEYIQVQQDKQRKTEEELETIGNSLENLKILLEQQKINSKKLETKQKKKIKDLSNEISNNFQEAHQLIQKNQKETIGHFDKYKNKIESLQNTVRKYASLIWGILIASLLAVIVLIIKNKRFNSKVLKLKKEIQKNREDINLFFQEQINLCHQILESNSKKDDAEDRAVNLSLALKVADEITLMERNMAFMDASVKGFKQLRRSLETLKDKLNEQGYEIPELLGKKFDSGMKLTVISSFLTDKLPTGEEVISKIIKPQVNFQGKMIQSAQVEVSIGE